MAQISCAVNPQVKLLSLQRPYALHCDFSSGLFSVPLALSGREETGSYRTQSYQLVRSLLEKGLPIPQGGLNEVQLESLAIKEQHMMQPYYSGYLNNACCFYW